MAQSHYHVFLPPTLSSLSLDGPVPRLVFQDLVIPRDVESQLDFGRSSQVERLKRISLSLAESQSQSHPQGSGQGKGKGKGKGKQKAEEELDEDLVDQAHHFPPTSTPVLDIDYEAVKSVKRKSVDGGNTSTSTRGNSIKRSRAPLTLSGNTVNDEEGISVEVDNTGSRSGSRRRSSRVRRSTSGLLGTFPLGTDTQDDESYLSLNTTISSLPPSGEVSSVLNLPKWSIPLTKLSSLPTLLTAKGQRHGLEEKKISVIVCILSVDTPVLRQRKEEKRRGQEGTLWIGGWVVTAPNTWPGYAAQGDGGGCGVKLWGEAARDWGEGVVRKGDVVLLEIVTYKPPFADQSAQISISSIPPSKIQILYRTLPNYHLPSNPYIHTTAETTGAKVVPEDRELRPDLRLGRSDLGVRRVGEIVRWFAGFIGGDAPL